MRRLNNTRNGDANGDPVFNNKINNNVISKISNDEMEGKGFREVFQSIMKNASKGAVVGSALDKFYTSEVGTALRNAVPDSDNTASPGYPGERHMILKLKNGKNGVANWMGPGTEVLKRLNRGDTGRTPSDMVAMRHDTDFTISQMAPDKKTQLKLGREADHRMINSLKKIQKGAHGGDANRNIQAGMRLIQAKVKLEDAGLLNKSKFTGELKNFNNNDKILLLNTQRNLEQEGYGLKPGQQLKKKLLKKMVRDIKIKSMKNKNKTKKGNGLFNMSNENVVKYVEMKILPNIMKSIGLKNKDLDIKKIKHLITKVVKISKNGLPSIIKNLTKLLLPLLTHSKSKSLKLGLSGKGVIDVLKNSKYGLDKKLATGLYSAFKWFINSKANKKGMKPIFKGSGLNTNISGQGFFKDFARGFKKIFVPGSKILGPLITPFAPEIGIPLTIISDIL